MHCSALRHLVVLIVLFSGAQLAMAEPLQGDFGSASGPGWAAAWLDLDQPQDFRSGERLCLRIGGAQSVLVRFLPVGESPDRPVGIDNGVRNVPESDALEVTLVSDHPRVRQISVHGGEGAWTWEFPNGNLAPTIVSVDRLSDGRTCQ